MKTKIRGHPLLEPPKTEDTKWRRVTYTDTELMRGKLEDLRSSESARMWHIYCLKELGLLESITKEDREVVLCQIDNYRKTQSGGELSDALCIMPELGVPQEMTRQDREIINKLLKKSRRNRRGIGVMNILHNMMRLQENVKVRDSDVELMEATLKNERGEKKYLKEHKGLNVAWVHYMMRGIGYGEDVTKEDLTLMEEALAAFRKSKDGANIARLHFYLSKILPPLQTGRQDASEMPPLREFVK